MSAADKTNGVESEWVRAPQPSGPLWRRLLKVIYNPEEKSFLGRSPKRWGIVFAFYLVFYALLAVLFAICMGGLFYSLDKTRPTYILQDSLIGSNPGVAYRPISPNGLAIAYSLDNSSSYEILIEQLNEFLEPYRRESWLNEMENFTSDQNYGYPDTPWFIIKLNKVYGWEPQCYDVKELPADMPADLVEYIQGNDHAQVWLSCWDELSNATRLEYPWGRGLAAAAFPYLNGLNYRSPLLAVRVTPSVNNLAVIRCRMWAKNISYKKSVKEPSGYTRFLLYVTEHSANKTEAN